MFRVLDYNRSRHHLCFYRLGGLSDMVLGEEVLYEWVMVGSKTSIIYFFLFKHFFKSSVQNVNDYVTR